MMVIVVILITNLAVGIVSWASVFSILKSQPTLLYNISTTRIIPQNHA